MGVVYKADHPKLGHVALKLMRPDSDPGFEARFSREAECAASIRRHENVVNVYDSGVEDDRLFLAMRWVDGRDLRSILDAGRLLPKTAVQIVLQVAHGLDAVHATMVHRDVKPSNIVISFDGEVPHAYLADFGIARRPGSDETLTHGGVSGTPGYLAPEQWMGRPVDERTDLYALGCVLFEAISGRQAFPPEDDDEIGYQEAHSTPPSLAALLGPRYEPFDQFLTSALAFARAGRYSSANEFASALEAAEAEFDKTGDQTLPSGPATPTSPRPQPSPVGQLEFEEARNPKPGFKVIAFITWALALLIAAAAVVVLPLSGSNRPGHWLKPVDLGAGPLGSAPTAGADGSGSVYVYWQGLDGSLWEKWFTKGKWNGPTGIRAAGHIGSQPAVAVHGGGQQDLFWVSTGTAKNLWHVTHTNAWSKAENLKSGPLGSAPTAGADENGGMYVFWKGTKGNLWDKWNVDGKWNGPDLITAAGRGLASQPAVAVHADGDQDVFYVGTNGDLWEVSHTSAWGKPMDLGSGPLGSAPTAGVEANGDVYVFWEGTDGILWQKWNIGGRWQKARSVNTHGHPLASQPAVAVHAHGQVDVFWKGTDQHLWMITLKH
jgi:serine/threonine-protein kinase